MSVNPSPSLLDGGQIVKRVYDEANDAVRVEVAGGTSFAVALDSSDSIVVLGTEDGVVSGTPHALKVSTTGVVYVRADSISGATASLSSASSGVVLAAISSSGIKSYQLYAQVLAEDVAMAGTTGDIIARIDISPLSSGSTFYQTSNTLTVPSGTALNAVVIGTVLTSIVGLRVQLTLTTNSLAGADRVKFFLVGSSL